MAIKPKLQSLLASANEVTGEERTNLTDAVQDLVDGYGQGDSPVLLNKTYSKFGDYFFQRANTSDYILGKLMSNNSSLLSLNPYTLTKNLRFVLKFKLNSAIQSDKYPWLLSGNNGNYFPLLAFTYAGPYIEWRKNGNVFNLYAQPQGGMTLNEWYYVVFYWDKEYACLSLYDSSGNFVAGQGVPATSVPNSSNNILIGGGNQYVVFDQGDIDITESFVEADDTILWGKSNSLTQGLGVFNMHNPNEFTKVDYIESTGTQYIDTGFKPTTNTTAYIECEITEQPAGYETWASLASVQTDSGGTGNSFGFIYTRENQMCLGYNYVGKTYKIAIQVGGSSSYSLDDNVVSGTVACAFSTPSVAFQNNLNLFCRTYNASGTNKTMGMGKISTFVRNENGTKQNEFISVRHSQLRNIRGMFDVVNNNLHLNAGTGTFGIPSDTSNEINLAEYLASLT